MAYLRVTVMCVWGCSSHIVAWMLFSWIKEKPLVFKEYCKTFVYAISSWNYEWWRKKKEKEQNPKISILWGLISWIRRRLVGVNYLQVIYTWIAKCFWLFALLLTRLRARAPIPYVLNAILKLHHSYIVVYSSDYWYQPWMWHLNEHFHPYKV